MYSLDNHTVNPLHNHVSIRHSPITLHKLMYPLGTYRVRPLQNYPSIRQYVVVEETGLPHLVAREIMALNFFVSVVTSTIPVLLKRKCQYL